MPFKPEFKAPTEKKSAALWFVINEGSLLTRIEADRYRIPDTSDLEALQVKLAHRIYMGTLDGQPCFAGAPEDGKLAGDNFNFVNLRALFGSMPEELIWIAGRANQLIHWHLSHRYCGKCGRRTDDKADELAKICPDCRNINYPRLSPAVIVAVIKDDRILLARNRRFKYPFYSVLAGFVEPGESLEGCVAREIEEEVGITVKHIRYFGSQPWPFPDSLMIGFTAEYAGGEISVDGSEIVEAAWFSKDNLPEIPPKISIARQLIDWFVQR